MKLKKIRLELARCPEYPNGSDEFGYEIDAPLTKDGHIDQAAWKSVKNRCAVRRFGKYDDDEHGLLIHTIRGWLFDYDPAEEDDDEPLFRLDNHLFNEGEYVTVTEHDGQERAFQVVDVR